MTSILDPGGKKKSQYSFNVDYTFSKNCKRCIHHKDNFAPEESGD